MRGLVRGEGPGGESLRWCSTVVRAHGEVRSLPPNLRSYPKPSPPELGSVAEGDGVVNDELSAGFGGAGERTGNGTSRARAKEGEGGEGSADQGEEDVDTIGGFKVSWKGWVRLARTDRPVLRPPPRTVSNRWVHRAQPGPGECQPVINI